MTEKPSVWLNGRLVPHEQATVPLLAHGFARGSAVFEVFGIHAGPAGPCAFRMDKHLQRLENTVRALDMELKQSSTEIAAAVAETVAANRIGRGLAKIMAYWADESIIQLVLDSPLDMAIFTIPESDELIFDEMERCISACISKWCKIHPKTVPVGAKACANYLNGYLVRKDAVKRGFDTGLMLGTDGFLAEGSTEAVFIVKDGVLKTPPLGRILASVSRLSILEAAPVLGIPVETEPVHPDEVADADEIFTAHTGSKIQPISRFEDRELEAPGPVTRRLIELFKTVLAFEDTRFQHWYQPL